MSLFLVGIGFPEEMFPRLLLEVWARLFRLVPNPIVSVRNVPLGTSPSALATSNLGILSSMLDSDRTLEVT